MSKCRSCRAAAVIEVRRHNAAFCRDCFLRHCREQVRRTIDEHQMIGPGERVLIAVSGGKDSLALWDVLCELGHDAVGLYVGLGIGAYSDESRSAAQKFAERRSAKLVEVDLGAEYGIEIPEAARAAGRAPCSVCGMSKRHVFNRAALDGGYNVLATGHNLDDEAAVLFGNILRWSTEYLGRQVPVLPESPGFVRKVKPLIRLGERETAAYCVLSRIDYIVDECPHAVGNKHLGYKDALNRIEEQSPGAKAAFYLGFLDKVSEKFRPDAIAEQEGLRACRSCGAPTTNDGDCAFCSMLRRASA